MHISRSFGTTVPPRGPVRLSIPIASTDPAEGARADKFGRPDLIHCRASGHRRCWQLRWRPWFKRRGTRFKACAPEFAVSLAPMGPYEHPGPPLRARACLGPSLGLTMC